MKKNIEKRCSEEEKIKIRNLFLNGVKIEEIKKITGFSLTTIAKYTKDLSRKKPQKTKREITYVIDEKGCWNCNSHYLNSDGYPIIHRDNKRTTVVKYLYKEKFGEIPPKQEIRHLCGNRQCINLNHITIGTHKENIHDTIKMGRKPIFLGEKNGSHKLTKKDVFNIRKFKENFTAKELAKIYGVYKSTISKIWQKITWKHI